MKVESTKTVSDFDLRFSSMEAEGGKAGSFYQKWRLDLKRIETFA